MAGTPVLSTEEEYKAASKAERRHFTMNDSIGEQEICLVNSRARLILDGNDSCGRCRLSRADLGMTYPDDTCP